MVKFFLDACLCPGMNKVVTATNRGRLTLFDAKVRGKVIDSSLPVNEHVETKMIVKVAHEVKNEVTPRKMENHLILFPGRCDVRHKQ